MATKTKKESPTAVTSDNSINTKYNELLSLSESLVLEIDNAMTARLTPGQLGQVLGNVVLGYKEEVLSLIHI